MTERKGKAESVADTVASFLKSRGSTFVWDGRRS